jgi:hypothetical protein
MLGSTNSFKLDMFIESGEFFSTANIIDANGRLSGFLVPIASVLITASLPDIISKRTTPKA